MCSKQLMCNIKRALCMLAFSAWIGFLGCIQSYAQADYPSRVVKIIVPTGAGGATDLTARSVAQTLTQVLGQPFVVENRPGAHGILAVNTLMRSEHDGYTLLLMASSQSVLPALYQLPYDPVAEFSPIALLSIAPVILVVNSDLPVTSVPELIQYAKQHPTETTYGYQGGPPQLASAQFVKLAGFKAVGVPFNASAQVTSELLAGRLTFTLLTAEQAKAQVNGGKLRALATAGGKRATAFPQLPTLQELGYPVDGSGWFGLVGPRDLGPGIVKKLHMTIEQNFVGKSGQATLVKAGFEPTAEGPEEFTARIKSAVSNWISIGEDLGIKKEKM
jgi:tripartite-type tricarboxylate transporter receptor subunit TctC